MILKHLPTLLWMTPALLGATLMVTGSAIASELDDPAATLDAWERQLLSPLPASAGVEPSQAALLGDGEMTAGAIARPQPQLIAPAETLPSAPISASAALSGTLSLAPVHQANSGPGASNAMAQVTSVSQLSDVQPTDWAFQALQSLVERYGVIAGYPDGTFRGNRALTRYEFAAGLNAALDRVNELIAAGLAETVTAEDLAALQRLQEEFAAELATLRGRVDVLEARTAELEANQFSTTTKLFGEVIFSIADVFGDQVGDANNTVFQDRVRLDLVTSFTGEDALHTRLAAGSVAPFLVPGSFINNGNVPNQVPFGTAEGLLNSRVGGNTDNDIELDWLAYYFPMGDRIQAYVAATGGIHSDYVFSTVNPYFDDFDGGNGSISPFSQSSPIYRIGGGAGAALNFVLDSNETLVLTTGYLADEAADPSPGSGLFNGDYAALGQLTYTPSDTVQLAFTYVHGYHGSDNAIFDLGIGDQFYTGSVPANATHVALGTPAVTNSYGLQASWQVSPQVVVNAFGGYTDVILTQVGDGQVWYYGLGLAFPDLFQPGNLGGIMVGVEPYLGGLDSGPSLGDLGLENDTSLHIEAFYKYQLTDNISITPGLIWITAPDQNSSNDGYVVGTLRTTFTF